MERETERAESFYDLRQGDILRIEGSVPPNERPELGVIINADCDLANGKTDGVIAYLPIYPFRVYLERFWAPNYVAREKADLLKWILKVCDFEGVFENDLVVWLQSSQPDEVASKIVAERQMKGNAAAALVERLIKLHACISTNTSPLDVFRLLCRREGDPTGYARRQLDDAKKSMGDGHFFISEVVGEPDVGFVIRMRRIYTIDHSSCFNSIATQRAGSSGVGVTAARIARLTPVYRFKLGQLFAYQFSRIGLPDEITSLGKLAIDDMVSQITGVNQ